MQKTSSRNKVMNFLRLAIFWIFWNFFRKNQKKRVYLVRYLRGAYVVMQMRRRANWACTDPCRHLRGGKAECAKLIEPTSIVGLSIG